MKVVTPLITVLWLSLAPAALADTATAMFAGGCFWCMEAVYQEQEGVSDVVSGFTGGTIPNPTYKGNHAGHFEAVKVSYDPAVISYQDLLDLYYQQPLLLYLNLPGLNQRYQSPPIYHLPACDIWLHQQLVR